MTAQEIVRANRDAKVGREAPGALILGGAHGSLAVARSLGRRGIPVWFATHDHPIAKYSRYVSRSFEWAGPSDKGAADWLVELSASHQPERWVLFAGGDEEVRLVARNHAMLQRAYRVTTPPWEIVGIACDKRLTHEHAGAIGVDSPWSRYPRNRDEVAALNCRFPVILQPRVHAGRNAFSAAKAWRVDDRAGWLARYDEAAALVGPDGIAIQELIPGGGEVQFSYAAVWSEGASVASWWRRGRANTPSSSASPAPSWKRSSRGPSNRLRSGFSPRSDFPASRNSNSSMTCVTAVTSCSTSIPGPGHGLRSRAQPARFSLDAMVARARPVGSPIARPHRRCMDPCVA